ncbi:hypothetical protein B296_00028447 [Ensete ventricosum]|uniref:Uncharacterized protein n=1 Tax=Ensete ventricosum TaxID=4639 RepID=A0A426Z4T7_ENSVE|nr:hypothetical protein B296_00028447 [Ensete ventricosum]
MDDELLQSVKALESAQAELPKQAVDRYKELVDFKEGLKRMGHLRVHVSGGIGPLPRSTPGLGGRGGPLHHPSRGRSGADEEAVDVR